MLAQPRPHLRLAVHARLQLLQHADARLDRRGLVLRLAQLLLCRAALGLHIGLALLQQLLLLGRDRLFFLRRRQLHRQPLQLVAAVVAQLLQRHLQALTPLTHRRQRVLVRTPLNPAHLQRLLGLLRRLPGTLQRLAPARLLLDEALQLLLGLGQCHFGCCLCLAGFFELHLHVRALLRAAL